MYIIKELKNHLPFTVFGALTAIVIMVFFINLPKNISLNIFYTLHPMHVVFSAFVTASIYQLALKEKTKFWKLMLIGYFGSIGIATISDSLIPYLGEILLDMPHRHAHLGFIEKWWLINPIALISILAARFIPTTKIPHSLHVLVSTWASLFHIMMAKGEVVSVGLYIGIFLFLIVAVWLPCCISDIVFPLLFVSDKNHIHSHS